MQNRTTELKSQLALLADRLAGWQTDVQLLRAEADTALSSRIGQPRTARAVQTIAAAVAEDMDRFYFLARSCADLPGVRDGQFNGLGIALERLSETCGRILVDLETLGEAVAA